MQFDIIKVWRVGVTIVIAHEALAIRQIHYVTNGISYHDRSSMLSLAFREAGELTQV